MSKKSSKKIGKFCYPKSFNSEKYPKFIRKSLYLRVFPKPEKVFPRLGLKNCESHINSIKSTEENLSTYKIGKIIKLFNNAKLIVDDAEYDLELLLDHLEETNNLFTKTISGRFNTINFKKNSLLTDVLRQFAANIGKSFLKSLNDILKIKKIKPSELISKNNIKICFSSDGYKGYWDIATMSMRKISSCMRWDSSHATSLIGSLVDPYTGIIYLTDDTKTKYGKSMIARAVVRLVVDRKRKKPIIFIENVYSNSRTEDVHKSYMSIFKSYIEQKVKIGVVCAKGDDRDDFCDELTIPITEPVEVIIDNDDSYDYSSDILSYRDSCIEYGNIKKFYNPKNIKLNA